MTTIKIALGSPEPRLDLFLVKYLQDYSRSAVQRLIREGRVAVDGETVTKSGVQLAGGEQIGVQLPHHRPITVQPEDIPLRILYEDDAMAVIDKPVGIAVHPGHGNPGGTLVNGLVYHLQQLSHINGALRPGIVHRLDKNTSGVIVVAKTDSAHIHIARQFEGRRVEKQYKALVWGTPPPQGQIKVNIVRDPRNRLAFTTDLHRGRRAITRYKIAEAYSGFSLLDVFPATGRTHQIRVHLKYIGCPIFADELYGGVKRAANIPFEQRGIVTALAQLLQRQALHAYGLTLTHPVTEETMYFTAPLPDDFQLSLDLLNKWSARA